MACICEHLLKASVMSRLCVRTSNLQRYVGHFQLEAYQRAQLSTCSSTIYNLHNCRSASYSRLSETWKKQLSSPTYRCQGYSPFSTTDTEVETISLGKIEKSKRLLLAFTCTVCNTRMSRTISKVAYSKGVVIVRCDGCDNRHLIADNLGWFQDASGRNIEEILQSKGESVRKHLTPEDSLEVLMDKEDDKKE